MVTKPGETKRVKISKAQRATLLEVLGASLVLGFCGMLAINLVKYISFNASVIGVKNDAISDYDVTIRNAGLCEDANGDGRLSEAELEACNPNTTALSKIAGTLRANIYNNMAANLQLESVARNRDKDGVCYTEKGELIDYISMYEVAQTDAAKERALEAAKICSALRVIPDALPNQKNTEALMASLNQLFIVAQVEPETMAPKDDIVETEIAGVGVIPVSFLLKGTDAQMIHVLNSLEKSVRTFDVTSAIVEWSSAGLEMNANAQAYYMDISFNPEVSKTITPRTAARQSKTSNDRSLTNASSAATQLKENSK